MKQKHFQALSQYHKALACEAESKYGEGVGRLALAEAAAKEASRIALTLSSFFVHGLTPTLPADTATALQEITKAMAATCTEKKNSATRDNDMVYNDTVPNEGVISPIDKLKAVKPIPIAELYVPNEIQKVIGADIFLRLIPLAVHESASLYSEEKAKIVRGETEKRDLANGELEAALEYMRLPAALDKFKRLAQGGEQGRSLDEFAIPTTEVREWADRIKEEEETKGTVYELVETLDGIKTRAKEMLDTVTMALDEEMRACEGMRVSDFYVYKGCIVLVVPRLTAFTMIDYV